MEKDLKESMSTDEMTQKIVIAAVAFVIGFGIAWFWQDIRSQGQQNMDGGEDMTKTESPQVSEPSDTAISPATSPPTSDSMLASAGKNSLSVSEAQMPGDKVFISQVTLEKRGWVAIHEDKGGAPARIIGARRFRPGDYSNQEVALILASAMEGKTYYAMLHSDDGDDAFDYKKDIPLKDVAGNLFMTKFTVTSPPTGKVSK